MSKSKVERTVAWGKAKLGLKNWGKAKLGLKNWGKAKLGAYLI
jgi:hypothetical protein